MTVMRCQMCGEPASECDRPIVDLAEARAELLDRLAALLRDVTMTLTYLDALAEDRGSHPTAAILAMNIRASLALIEEARK